jgi:hypothetical protein
LFIIFAFLHSNLPIDCPLRIVGLPGVQQF